jgi:SAM-dependent methyltransferase
MESLWDRGRNEARIVKVMLEKYNVRPGAKLLELGAGVGRVAAHLATMGYLVDGVEYSRVFIDRGRKLLQKLGLKNKVRLIYGDVYKLDEVIGNKRYDATYMVWCTLLGYGLSQECDRLLLKLARQHVRPRGLLVIANTISYDREALSNVCGCRGPFITFTEHYAIIEEPYFDPIEQILINRWAFYKRENSDLKYIDEARYKLYIYTLRELTVLAKDAGWQLLAASHDPVRESPYRPGVSKFNLVFRAIENDTS